MIETNAMVIRRLQQGRVKKRTNLKSAPPSLFTLVDYLMARLDAGSRILMWVAAIVTLFFILVPAWFKIFLP